MIFRNTGFLSTKLRVHRSILCSMLRVIVLLASILIISKYGFAVGTAFTYQGRLTDSGNPAYGVYDFEFKVYNAESDGTQIGSAVNKEDITVSNGMFTVELDFGSGIFTGSDRWLEIGVRPGISAGAYSLLTPRQKITPTPYALSLPGLWTEENTTSPNLIGGYEGNSTTGGVIGGTIGGGGYFNNTNKATDSYGTVSGGANNQAGDGAGTASDKSFATVSGGYGNVANGGSSTVPGGYWNIAAGDYSLAAGRRARANHPGSFVWADSTNADFATATSNQFLIRANGGVGINTNSLGGYGLRVAGSVGVDGNLDMATDGSRGRILNVSNPVSTYDAVNKSYVDSQISSSLTSLNQLVEEFVVASGETVSAGDVVVFINESVKKGGKIELGSEYVFNSTYTSYISASALSSNTFVVAYEDKDNSSYGTAVVGNVSGTTITYGSKHVFNNASTNNIFVSTLSFNKFVVAYRDEGNSNYGTAIVGEVSGTVISYGSEYVFNCAATSNVSISALSSDKFAVAYKDEGNSNYGTAVVGEVSGTVIGYGTEYIFNNANVYNVSVSALSSSKFVVAYEDDGNSDYGTGIVGEVSGTVISYGSEYVFNSASTAIISVSALSSNKFIVAYRDDGNSSYGTMVVGEVTGTVIGYGAECIFNNADTSTISISAISSNKFIVAYEDGGNSSYGTIVVGEVSGTTATYGLEYVFNTEVSYGISATILSSEQFVVAYMDVTGSVPGSAVAGEIRTPIGIANEAATSGANVPVIIHGVSSLHSGLIPGQFYYLQSDGSLTSDSTEARIGIAISSAKLLLDIER